MIQIIVGVKGSGKTKRMVDMINQRCKESNGHIVCVEKNMKLTFAVSHAVRLIDVDHYYIDGYDMFYGFYSGLLASNYDVTDVFVDGTLKIGGGIEGLEALLEKIDRLNGEAVNTVLTISTEEENLPESVRKYMI